MWFLANGLLTLIRKYADLPIGLEFYFVTGYVGYYVLGLLLGRITLDRRRIAIAGLVFLCALLFTFFAIYAGSQADGYDQFFESYLSFNVMLLTAAGFVILKAANKLIPDRAANLILPFSRASLGIYLIHVMVLAWFDGFSVGQMPWLQGASTIFVMPGVAAAAFVMCFAAVYILQKIPLIRYTVPW